MVYFIYSNNIKFSAFKKRYFWFGLVWFGLVWFGLVWFDLV
jgi:hypothetical protein